MKFGWNIKQQKLLLIYEIFITVLAIIAVVIAISDLLGKISLDNSDIL